MVFERSCFLLTPILFAACGGLSPFIPDGTQDTAVDDSNTPALVEDPNEEPPPSNNTGDAPTVTRVTPDFASNAGGQTVVIEGADFPSSFDLTFGGISADVVSSSATRIEAIVPATTTTGWVDVQVYTAAGNASLPDGFQFWSDGEGLTGAVATLERIRWVGGYWGSTPGPSAWATLSFFNPMAFEYWENYTDTFGGCSTNYYWNSGFDYYEPGAASISVTGPGGSLAMEPTDQEAGLYRSEFVDASVFSESSDYFLDEIQGTANWPSFEFDEPIATAGRVGIVSPDVNRALAPVVGPTIDVAWDGTPADYVIVSIAHFSTVFTDTSYELAQLVTCAVPDNGSFQVPESAWLGWRLLATDYLAIEVGRVRETTMQLPHDNSDAKLVSVSWTVGAMDMTPN